METIIKELEEIVNDFVISIKSISKKDFNDKPNPDKWSKKEVVGHLIDSAQNNLRRFIVAQYEDDPHIVYDQDFWVNSNSYQHMPNEDVLKLWELVNVQIISTLKQMPVENYSRNCNTGKTEAPSHHSLLWLAADYVKHMKHHLNQIIPNSFDSTYPS